MPKEIVFVIGAGASAELGLPTGYDLRKKISALLNFEFHDAISTQLLRGDETILSALRTEVGPHGPLKPFIEKARLIRDAMPQAESIDNYLDSHSGDRETELCGKLAIVRSILEAERRSKLYFQQHNMFDKLDFWQLENTWYIPLTQILQENCTLDALEDRLKQISFIVFNYDRCLERYLQLWLENYFRLGTSEAIKLVSQMQIYHPYGKIGTLSGMSGDGTEPTSGFGAEVSGGELLQLSRNVRTFTEGTDPDSSEINVIRSLIDRCEMLVFLGFAFHRLNLKLLQPDKPTKATVDCRCFGTAKGLSDSDRREVESMLRIFRNDSGCSMDVTLENKLKCSDFLRDYRRTLSLTV